MSPLPINFQNTFSQLHAVCSGTSQQKLHLKFSRQMNALKSLASRRPSAMILCASVVRDKENESLPVSLRRPSVFQFTAGPSFGTGSHLTQISLMTKVETVFETCETRSVHTYKDFMSEMIFLMKTLRSYRVCVLHRDHLNKPNNK